MSEAKEQQCEHGHRHTAGGVPDVAFKVGISLNLGFVFIEIYFGWIHNSLALVSDAIHNLTDVFGLLLAWLGYALSKTVHTKRVSIYAALINSGLLLVSSCWVIFEAYQRYYAQEAPVAITMMIVAGIGCFINFTTARFFHRDHHHDLNIRSAYLHLMADAAISLGVVLAGALIYYTSQNWVDPVLSAVISVIIIVSAWGLFTEAFNMLRGKKPKSVHLEDVRQALQNLAHVVQVGEIRVWALSTAENALSAEIRWKQAPSAEQLHRLKHDLEDRFRITQVDLTPIDSD